VRMVNVVVRRSDRCGRPYCFRDLIGG
jgi:hypothetical protein